MKKSSIVMLTCWYGPYPWYMPYFIHSCLYNPTIDFVIITDNRESIPNQPPNVRIHYQSKEAIVNTATKKLGFAVNIGYAYKLCDFKPAYGFLFPGIIKGYDFWGHADIDVVYGAIRDFMTEEVLKDHDIISSRHDYITGTFCLFRNNRYINRLFMESRDYKQVFSSAEHFCFDECNFLFRELENGASVFDFPDHIQSMTYVVKKAANEGRVRAFFDFMIIEGAAGNIKWQKGKVIYRNMYEAMFYHLIKFKNQCMRPKILNPIPDTFYFTPKKIMAYTKSEIPAL